MANLTLSAIGLFSMLCMGGSAFAQQQEKVYRICHNLQANECRVQEERCAIGETEPSGTSNNKIVLCRTINRKTDPYYATNCPKRPVPGC
jgi:hypothetical protein